MITGSALRAWGLLSLLLALLGCAYIFHFSASATPSDVRPFVVEDALMPQCVERHRHDKVEERGVNVSGSMRVRRIRGGLMARDPQLTHLINPFETDDPHFNFTVRSIVAAVREAAVHGITVQVKGGRARLGRFPWRLTTRGRCSG